MGIKIAPIITGNIRTRARTGREIVVEEMGSDQAITTVTVCKHRHLKGNIQK